MPYTPILNIGPILQSTLDLVEHTEYPHKGNPALLHVQKALRDAIAALHELEALQLDATGKPYVPPQESSMKSRANAAPKREDV